MKFNKIISAMLTAVLVCVVLAMPVMAADKKKPEEKTKAAETKLQPLQNVAKVNGKFISFADYEVQLELFQRRLQAQGQTIPPQFLGAIRNQVLNDMVSSELLWQESQKKGFKLDADQVDKEFKAIKERNPDQAQFARILANMNLTEEGLKEQIAQRGAVRALLDKEIISKIEISEKEAKAFYDANPNYFQKPEQVHASHILIKVAKDATPEQKAQARKKMIDIQKRLAAGEDFATLAKENSDGPSGAEGGDLGFFSRGKWAKSFEDAAFALKDNEVSDIVETDLGYHLIKLMERRPSETVAYAEAKPRILINLRNDRIRQKVMEYVQTLRQDAKIETYLE